MKKIFSVTNRIKHSDWPYILQHFFLYILLMVLAAWVFSGILEIGTMLGLTAFVIVLTLFHIYRLQKDETEHLQYKIQAIGEIQKLLPLRAPIQPMTGWAATPELAAAVLRHIILHKPDTIVEFGSGVTTLINGYGLETYHPTGKLISLDHDPDYAKITETELENHKLSGYSEIRIAPLKPVNCRGKTYTWYDSEHLSFSSGVDLLIVDGPPVKTEQFARYPALPLMADHLSRNCTIILHDTNRAEEGAIVEMWLNEFPEFTADKKYTDKGITLLNRRS